MAIGPCPIRFRFDELVVIVSVTSCTRARGPTADELVPRISYSFQSTATAAISITTKQVTSHAVFASLMSDTATSKSECYVDDAAG
jgi:hypothetical protein